MSLKMQIFLLLFSSRSNSFCSMSFYLVEANAVLFWSIFVVFLFSFSVQTQFFQTEINFYYLEYDGQRAKQSNADGISQLFEKHSTSTVFIFFCVFVCVYMYHKNRRCDASFRFKFLSNVQISNESFFVDQHLSSNQFLFPYVG